MDAVTDFALDAGLRSRLERCATLPTLPAVAIKVLDLCQRDALDLAEIAKTLGQDPALAAKVLRTINSSVFGLRDEVRTLAHATALLGANAIRTLALSFSLAQGLKKNDRNVLAGYWRRSLVSAVAARELAGLCKGVHPDEAFLAGLLQDIGMLALARVMSADYPRLYAEAKGHHVRCTDAERRLLGCDHAAVGAWLAERWRLPKATVLAISASHDPGVLLSARVAPELVRLVQVAALAGHLAEVWVSGSAAESVRHLEGEASRWFPEALPHLEPALAKTAANMQVAAGLFDEDVGKPQEIEEVLERAKEALVVATLRATQEVVHAQCERERLEAKTRELEQLSATDALTGLFNRAVFDAYLHEQLAACLRSHTPLSLVLIDIDHFKQINDRFGHPAGDQVLKALARCLGGIHRAKDRACRYGGEEFAVILPETDTAGARVVGERLREQMAGVEHRLSGGIALRVTASVGIATWLPAFRGLQAWDSPAGLVAAADEALYAAKHAGRNRVAVWSAHALQTDHPTAKLPVLRV
jgi:diguanylate cyclase (GGDEF)-like protein